MSERLPRVGPDKVIKFLKRKGFTPVRQSGSHMIFRNESGVRVTLPYHAKKTLHPKLIKSILADTKTTVEEFNDLI